MNERIKKLLLQANIYDGRESMYWCEEKNLVEFAELIVRECIGCCEQVISDPVPKSVDTFEQGGIHCMNEIKQHFGVE